MSIKNNITSLQSILDKVNALPEAGGESGSTSYNTCIVEVTTNIRSAAIYSTIDENGKMITTWTQVNNSNTYSLTVICGSYIFVPVASSLPGYIINGDAEFIETQGGYSIHRTMVFKINGTSTINCYDDD